MRLKNEVMWSEIAKISEKLDGYEGQALSQLVENYKTCRNELCLKCGRYTESHLGACEGCRWQND